MRTTSTPTLTATGRLTATARCAHCEWEVQLTGDDAVEIAQFLRERMLAHITEEHPDRLAAEARRRGLV